MVSKVTLRSPASCYTPGRHFKPLDGLRGMAILIVLCAHFGLPAGANLFDRLVAQVEGFGVSGVDLFFVLSGFLISGILIDAKGDSNYFLSFYMRRTLRIFPLYYAYVAALLLAMPLLRFLFHGIIHASAPTISHQGWIWLYGSNVAVSIFPNFIVPGFEHLWSLAVEEQFYLVWPLVVLLASRRWLGRICVAMIVAAPLLRELCWLAQSPTASIRLMPMRMDALAYGGLIALAVRQPDWVHRFSRSCNTIMATTGTFMILLIAWRGPWETLDVWLDTVGLSLVSIFFAALLVKVLAADSAVGQRIFGWTFLQNVGKYSYGIYMLHVIAAHVLEPLVGGQLHKIPLIFGSQILRQAVFTVAIAALSYGLAWTSWHAFEKWFLLLKAKFPYHDRKSAAVSEMQLTGVAVS